SYRIARASVAASDTEFLVLADVQTTGSTLHELRAFEVSPMDGSSDGGRVVATLPGFGFQGETALAWDGREFLAVWSTSAPDGGNVDLYGLRLARDGTLTDGPFPIAAGPLSLNAPVVASPRKGEFVIAWTEGKVLPTRTTSARATFRRWLYLPLGSACAASAEC